MREATLIPGKMIPNDLHTSRLDDARYLLGELMRELSRERTLIMTTHDLREADQLCDYCLFMVGSVLRAHGPRAKLLASASANSLEEAFFHYCGARVTAGGEVA